MNLKLTIKFKTYAKVSYKILQLILNFSFDIVAMQTIFISYKYEVFLFPSEIEINLIPRVNRQARDFSLKIFKHPCRESSGDAFPRNMQSTNILFYFHARVLGWLNASENVRLRITVRKLQRRKYMVAHILFDVRIIGRRDKFILEIRADRTLSGKRIKTFEWIIK